MFGSKFQFSGNRNSVKTGMRGKPAKDEGGGGYPPPSSDGGEHVPAPEKGDELDKI